MYGIYGNIYHQYTPFMLAYIPYMDPMGYLTCHFLDIFNVHMSFSTCPSFASEQTTSATWSPAVPGHRVASASLHGDSRFAPPWSLGSESLPTFFPFWVQEKKHWSKVGNRPTFEKWHPQLCHSLTGNKMKNHLENWNTLGIPRF